MAIEQEIARNSQVAMQYAQVIRANLGEEALEILKAHELGALNFISFFEECCGMRLETVSKICVDLKNGRMSHALLLDMANNGRPYYDESGTVGDGSLRLSNLHDDEFLMELRRRAEREKGKPAVRLLPVSNSEQQLPAQMQVWQDVRLTRIYIQQRGLSEKECDTLFDVCCEKHPQPFIQIGSMVFREMVTVAQLKLAIRREIIMDAQALAKLPKLPNSKLQALIQQTSPRTHERGGGGKDFSMGIYSHLT